MRDPVLTDEEDLLKDIRKTIRVTPHTRLHRTKMTTYILIGLRERQREGERDTSM